MYYRIGLFLLVLLALAFLKQKAVRRIAVGARLTACPPLRSVQAAFPHTAPTLGV